METKGFVSIWNPKCLGQHFPLHLNTCTFVMDLRPLLFNSFSAGIDFRLENLTSINVRFWRPIGSPRAEAVKLIRQGQFYYISHLYAHRSYWIAATTATNPASNFALDKMTYCGCARVKGISCARRPISAVCEDLFTANSNTQDSHLRTGCFSGLMSLPANASCRFNVVPTTHGFGTALNWHLYLLGCTPTLWFQSMPAFVPRQYLS